MEKENKKKSKNRGIAFSDKQEEMIKEINEHLGLKSFSSIIHYAIAELHRTLCFIPAYKQKTKTPEEKIKDRIDMKKLEEEAKLQERIDCCVNDFFGEAINGVCYYTSFGMTEEEDKKEELDLVSCYPEIAETTIFIPTKEAVLNARPKLAKKLNI